MRAIDEITNQEPKLNCSQIGRRVGVKETRVGEVIEGIARELSSSGDIDTNARGILHRVSNRGILKLKQEEVGEFVKRALEYYEEKLSGT